MAEIQGKTPSLFSADGSMGQAVLEWWKRMQGLTGENLNALETASPQPGVTGERAELKRAESLAETVFTPAYQRLRLALLKTPASRPTTPAEEAAVAALARVLVRVKAAETAKSFPRRMGEPGEEGGDKPRVSELRFKRLLRSDNPADLADVLIRLLPMLEHRANPLELAEAIWFWNEMTRKRWADAYFQALLG